MLQPIKLPVRQLTELGLTQDEALMLQQVASLVQDVSQLGFNTSFYSLVTTVIRARPLVDQLSAMARRLQPTENQT